MQLNFDTLYPSRRSPVLARNVVSSSQPLAAQAGLRMLLQGGNAIDAALAAAMTLTVVEPVMNGIGGDMFALVWRKGELYGLESSGRSPAGWTRDHFGDRQAMPQIGWDTVTVPGQVAGWKELSARFGRLPFAELFAPAIHYAQEGFPLSPVIARIWSQQTALLKNEPGFAQAWMPDGRAPVAGQTWRFQAQAETLAEISSTDGQSFYSGKLAERIADFARETGGKLTVDDLRAHKAQWVQPISQEYNGYVLHEIPPSGQGIAALIGLGMLQHFDLRSMGVDSADAYHLMAEAVKFAFADLHEHIGDAASMRVQVQELLDADYLRKRANEIDLRKASAPTCGAPSNGGTVYLTAADAEGTMVSFIQSNFRGFGSGVTVPGTGISLHNRGAGFTLTRGHVNEAGPRKKPLHTIIPGFVTWAGKPVLSFGVMGGAMQAQGHLQMVSRLADFAQNPQAMCDAPRFRVDPGNLLRLEAHIPPAVAADLRTRGHDVTVAPADSLDFGSAQLIQTTDSGYVAASDGRRDGQAVGY